MWLRMYFVLLHVEEMHDAMQSRLCAMYTYGRCIWLRGRATMEWKRGSAEDLGGVYPYHQTCLGASNSGLT